jgi:hypothetical protein
MGEQAARKRGQKPSEYFPPGTQLWRSLRCDGFDPTPAQITESTSRAEDKNALCNCALDRA